MPSETPSTSAATSEPLATLVMKALTWECIHTGPVVNNECAGCARLRDAVMERIEPRLQEYEDLLGSIWLYIKWRYVTQQLTTIQKELFADAVDAHSRRLNEDNYEDWKPVAERWWRDAS